MPSDLYATEAARLNWYALFEELTALAWNGHTELHRTNRSTGPKSTDSTGREYPPVYHIEYVPRSWDSPTREQMDRLFAIADKHGAVVNLKGRNERGYAHFVCEFKHR